MANISEITFCRNIVLVTIRKVPYNSKIIGEILTDISSHGINIDMISQTTPVGNNISLSFTVSSDAVPALLPLIHQTKQTYPEISLEFSAGMTKLNFFDKDMVNTPGVSAELFTVLAQSNITVEMITTSTVDISILILESMEEIALDLCEEHYKITPEEVPFF